VADIAEAVEGEDHSRDSRVDRQKIELERGLRLELLKWTGMTDSLRFLVDRLKAVVGEFEDAAKLAQMRSRLVEQKMFLESSAV
jgi:hypothetical protein